MQQFDLTRLDDAQAAVTHLMECHGETITITTYTGGQQSTRTLTLTGTITIAPAPHGWTLGLTCDDQTLLLEGVLSISDPVEG
ncbi:hypothetical protein GCM10010156_74010 [Planobispora rosea]|uniref:Uncharacterized protein n=1 Tax=Planobispora rosea TaxID=35762 RepID=A0A8J3S936_PLARO|nr:hypothetical protein [Planobispora rosea]GGT05503.1 hypothetical protein GCM10010156_74010 [Planobispora rosea]GIH88950.1 hypothetical protein Pro02_73580 [Planobispora rosea]